MEMLEIKLVIEKNTNVQIRTCTQPKKMYKMYVLCIDFSSELQEMLGQKLMLRKFNERQTNTLNQYVLKNK